MTRWTSAEIAARDERNQRIDDHIQAGTCYICEQTVEAFTPVHGPTGAHWDCHSPHQVSLKSTLADLDKLIEELNPKSQDTVPRMARANGGQLVHIVVPSEGRSLCGHKPKDQAWRMKRRGKWLYFREDWTPNAWDRFCPKCQAVAAVKYPPVDEISELI